ncbi:eCIS core domain-containing protein [Coleofasciculus sp. E2-BRE-01]|uniref:eCIS core domain-containing protein n=1 Tax=Coleofasciculus sp. E2-BRE-01 TaxID=3069524 RepID=UPI0032F0A12F
MEYKPVQKKNSSWTPTTVQKKGKSPGKMGHFSIQPKSNPSSAPSQEIGDYSRASADRLAANVIRGIQAKEQEQAEGSTVQRKSESPWAPTFDAPPPLAQSPASQLKGAFAPVSENPIQRQCADCAKEEKEQAPEAGKDLEEIGIQTKLTVGAPGDPYEQEADRVASQVISMSAPPDSSASVQRQLDTNHPHHPNQIWQRAQSITPVVQRQIDPRLQMRQMIQRAAQIEGNQASGDLESRLNASKGGGSPLSENVRGFMEPRFGADFSGVRVHTGGEAVQMNQELGAQAFTHGNHIYFGAGKSPGVDHLTAHELTHVVQQSGISDSLAQKDVIQRTTIGDVLDEFFAPWSRERLWVMRESDNYTRIVRRWQPVINAVNQAKANLEANCRNWQANHLTDASWTPGMTDPPVTDPNAHRIWVNSPPGTDPETCKNAFIIYVTSKLNPIPMSPEIQTFELYTCSIGSFGIYATVDSIDCDAQTATMNIWMYNAMDQESFGRFANHPAFALSGMERQYMWWNWSEPHSWGSSANPGGNSGGSNRW